MAQFRIFCFLLHTVSMMSCTLGCINKQKLHFLGAEQNHVGGKCKVFFLLILSLVDVMSNNYWY